MTSIFCQSPLSFGFCRAAACRQAAARRQAPALQPRGKKTSFIRRCLVLLVSLTAVALAADLPAGGWQAGVAKRKITPETPLWMTGYAVRDHPAEGRAQDLWVKALALEDLSGKRAVLITADLCGVTRVMTDKVAGELRKRFAIARGAVMINVSHTHCGPALDGWAPGMRVATADEERATVDYTGRVVDDMVAVAASAI